MNIQTMELDLTNPLLIYTRPSKIWNINKNILKQFDYFNNLINFNEKKNNNDKIYLIKDISDKEMELLLNYINNNFNINNLDINEIMLLIKISDFLIIPELFKISTKEFFNRL